jgi:hypothetical protein
MAKPDGVTVGIPVVQGPPVGALTAGNNAAGAAAKTANVPTQANNNDQPSVIMVEVIGFGGGGADDGAPQPRKDGKGSGDEKHSYDPDSPFQIVGNGDLTAEQAARLYPPQSGRP